LPELVSACGKFNGNTGVEQDREGNYGFRITARTCHQDHSNLHDKHHASTIHGNAMAFIYLQFLKASEKKE
jgi:hypothetical protein